MNQDEKYKKNLSLSISPFSPNVYSMHVMQLKSLFFGKTEKGIIHIIRAMLSSALGFAIDFALLAFFVEIVGINYLVAASMSFTAGTTVTYFFAIKWIFLRRNVRDKRVEYLLFTAVGVAGVLLNGALLWLFTELVGVHYLVSKVISASMVFFWNFFARKYLLFK